MGKPVLCTVWVRTKPRPAVIESSFTCAKALDTRTKTGTTRNARRLADISPPVVLGDVVFVSIRLARSAPIGGKHKLSSLMFRVPASGGSGAEMAMPDARIV